MTNETVLILRLRRQDEFYTGTVGYNFPSQSLLLVGIADEQVGDRQGVYAGVRL